MAKKKRPKSMKGISRIDTDDTHGWYVRIYRNNKTYSKFYSDNKYGGKDRALKIAKLARDKAVKKWEQSTTLREKLKPNLVTKSPRNKTGVIGVTKYRRKNRSGTVSEYYQVTWRPRKGKVKNKIWSINKYGEEEAFKMACQFRHKKMKEIHGDRYNPEDAIVVKEREESDAPGSSNNDDGE